MPGFASRRIPTAYFLLMQGLLHCYGIPLALYTDRHPIFKH